MENQIKIPNGLYYFFETDKYNEINLIRDLINRKKTLYLSFEIIEDEEFSIINYFKNNQNFFFLKPPFVYENIARLMINENINQIYIDKVPKLISTEEVKRPIGINQLIRSLILYNVVVCSKHHYHMNYLNFNNKTLINDIIFSNH